LALSRERGTHNVAQMVISHVARRARNAHGGGGKLVMNLTSRGRWV